MSIDHDQKPSYDPSASPVKNLFRQEETTGQQSNAAGESAAKPSDLSPAGPEKTEYMVELPEEKTGLFKRFKARVYKMLNAMKQQPPEEEDSSAVEDVSSSQPVEGKRFDLFGKLKVQNYEASAPADLSPVRKEPAPISSSVGQKQPTPGRPVGKKLTVPASQKRGMVGRESHSRHRARLRLCVAKSA